MYCIAIIIYCYFYYSNEMMNLMKWWWLMLMLMMMNLELLYGLNMKFLPSLWTFLCLFSSNPFYKSLSGTIIQHFESTDSRHNPFWLFCLAEDRNRKWNMSITTIRLSRMAKSHRIVLFHVASCNKWVSCWGQAEQGHEYLSHLLSWCNVDVM